MTNAVVSFKQLGDMIMLEPLTRLLAARAGVATHFYAKHDFAPIVGLMPQAKAKVYSPTLYGELWSAHEGAKATRRAAVLLARRKTLILPFASRVRREHPLIYGTVRVVPTAGRYMARYFFEEAGGAQEAFTPPVLKPPPAAWKPDALGLPERYVVIHPTAAWRSKFWTPEKWASLIDLLLSETDLPVVLSGAPTFMDHRHCTDIETKCTRKPIAAFGKMTIPQYAWLIANARALVAIDGSACHFADAFGVPVVKLFGHSSEESWHYDRPGARLVTSGPGAFHDRPPTKELPLGDVIAAVKAMLGDRAPVSAR